MTASLRRNPVAESAAQSPGKRNRVSECGSAQAIAKLPRWTPFHGELAKLGITVSERTVSQLLRRPCRHAVGLPRCPPCKDADECLQQYNHHNLANMQRVGQRVMRGWRPH